MVPNSKPQQKKEKTEILLKDGGVDLLKYPCSLLGVRGYYLDTMGEAGKNDRGIYDDAIILLTPSAYVTFNANADPSAFRKGIANLKPGLWYYKLGAHGLSKPRHPSGTMDYTSAKYQYTALIQAAKVAVKRDQEGEETDYLGINIHRGSYNTTSSLGCQTIFPDQWTSFIELIKSQFKQYNQNVIPYLLMENTPSTNK
jgi:lysozyme